MTPEQEAVRALLRFRDSSEECSVPCPCTHLADLFEPNRGEQESPSQVVESPRSESRRLLSVLRRRAQRLRRRPADTSRRNHTGRLLRRRYRPNPPSVSRDGLRTIGEGRQPDRQVATCSCPIHPSARG